MGEVYSFKPREIKEVEKQSSPIHLELLRHGESNYLSFKAALEGKDPHTHFPDLTPDGVETIKKTADSLINKINTTTDHVFVLSSPEVRAIGSSSIIEQAFKERGIPVQDNAAYEELDEAQVFADGNKYHELLKLVPHAYLSGYPGPENVRGHAEETRKKIPHPDMDYAETWRFHAGKENLEKIETPRQIAERIKELFTNLNVSLSTMKQENERQFIIIISHNMFVDPLIEILFDEGLIKGKKSGLLNGESVSCDFDKVSGNMHFSFRGVTKTITLPALLERLSLYE